MGDFNGDGRDDLAAFNDSNPADKQWQVIRSTGSRFEAVETWSQTTISPNPTAIVAGDFNGDGRDDLLFKKSGSNTWTIAISDGSRFNVFDPNTVTTTWTSGRKGDFDGDGAEELLGWNTSAGRWETIKYHDHRGMSLDASWGSALGTVVTTQNTHIGDVNRDDRDDLVVFNATPGVNKWQVALSQQAANGTNSFVFQTPAADGTNDWDRWFNNWDWGPTATPYKFLNVDAPYQRFLDIFSDVYNTVELELYPGLMKGIEATAQTKAGNDWDQAALLVDRLEAAGFIDASIAFASVEADWNELAAWMGSDPSSPNATYAATKALLDSGAAQHTGINAGNVQFKHAWVRALAPSSSGLQMINVDPSWKFKNRQTGEFIDLKNVETHYAALSGRAGRGTFDEFGFLTNLEVSQLPIEWYEDQVMRNLVDSSKNKSLADIPFDGDITRRQFDSIPAGWNGGIEDPAVVQTFANLGAITSSAQYAPLLTHRVNIGIQKAGTTHLSETLVVPDHSLDAINITYVQNLGTYSAKMIVTPSSGNDTIYSAPAGNIFLPNDEVTLVISHLGPSSLQGASSITHSYTRKPGQIHAIGLDANQYSTQLINNLQAKVNATLNDGPSSADIKDLLNYTSAKYWHEFNRGSKAIDGLLRTIGGQQWVGSGIVTSDPYLLTESIPGLNNGNPIYSITELAHLQFPLLPSNIGVDIPNSTHVSMYSGAGPDLSNEAFQLVGFNGSALEHTVLEEVVNSQSMSTARGLQNAYASSGIRIYESVWDSTSNERKIFARGSISSNSSLSTYNPNGGVVQSPAQIQTSLSSDASGVHSNIIAASIAELLGNVNNQYGGPDGHSTIRVLIPNQKSSVGSWTGSVYVAEYQTASGRVGSYIIAPDGGVPSSGGYSGNVAKAANKILRPATFLNNTYAGDPVNVANGNMFRDEVDFKLANPIIPLDFARHYDSQNKLDVGFGVGWVHGFTGFIYKEQDPANSADQDFVWLRGNGERHIFENEDFQIPNTLFGLVETTDSGTNRRLTAFKDRNGIQYIFEPIANPFTDLTIGKQIYSRLVAIKDATGFQGVNITYESPTSIRVAKVESISVAGRRLEFVYNSNNTIDVKRFDGGLLVSTWAYALTTNAGYTGKRLTQVKHANQSDNVTSYAYYNDGPTARKGLIKDIIEPNLESHSYEYYANGRVFRVTDGAGNQQSFSYNLFRNLTEFTDERGNVETYIHQDNGLLTKQIHNDRSRVEYTWGPPSQIQNFYVSWQEFLMITSVDERVHTRSIQLL